MLASLISEKIKKYESIIDNATTVTTILDLRTDISLFEIGPRTTEAINKIREIFDQYITTSNKIMNVSSNKKTTDELE
ncbi:7669_t:CDS:2 [Cetraspora pellucida]|uniref:7669_t:CDS:1 n=1 Tax=Cetraspora pellucida TaxID=1433469 RepID=A0ACA9L8G6_9GLOM|nr:7669_t:CDS:2 [Cetraspora pellucida]